jgi:hypothetical protein
MKLKAPQVKKLAGLILARLKAGKLLRILTSEAKVLAKIEAIIFADLKVEEDIEREARAMMDKYRAQVESGAIDYQKMYGMIKKQLIKDKGFTA